MVRKHCVEASSLFLYFDLFRYPHMLFNNFKCLCYKRFVIAAIDIFWLCVQLSLTVQRDLETSAYVRQTVKLTFVCHFTDKDRQCFWLYTFIVMCQPQQLIFLNKHWNIECTQNTRHPYPSCHYKFFGAKNAIVCYNYNRCTTSIIRYVFIVEI